MVHEVHRPAPVQERLLRRLCCFIIYVRVLKETIMAAVMLETVLLPENRPCFTESGEPVLPVTLRGHWVGTHNVPANQILT